jgi:hypothetical protein
MDEVERSILRAKARSPGGFEEARRKPALLLLGLMVGIACAWVAGLFAFVFAPLLPLLVGGVMIVFKRTQAVALGVLAAAAGVLVFVVTLAVLFTAF